MLQAYYLYGEHCLYIHTDFQCLIYACSCIISIYCLSILDPRLSTKCCFYLSRLQSILNHHSIMLLFLCYILGMAVFRLFPKLSFLSTLRSVVVLLQVHPGGADSADNSGSKQSLIHLASTVDQPLAEKVTKGHQERELA